MKVNHNTFCAAPWFQVRQDLNGTFRSCCLIDHNKTKFHGQTVYRNFEEYFNSPYVKYLRTQLTQGEQLPECYICWHREKNNLMSLRQSINNTVTNNQLFKKSWLSFYFKNKTDYENDLLISADVKTNILCNFSCAMCNPADSSKIYSLWIKDKAHPLVQEILQDNPFYFENINFIYKDNKTYNMLREILCKKPKHLKLLGGEPLLDEYLIKILQEYTDKKNTSLTFITNGSVSLIDTQKKLSGYKSVNFIVSLEGINKVQDYIRKGSNWSNIENNILSYIKQFASQNLFIHCTLQALNVYHLPELITWTSNNNIRLGINQLVSPDYFTLNCIPEDLMNSICNRIKSNQTKLRRIDGEIITETTTDDLINLIKENYHFDHISFKKLKLFLDWYDPAKEWKKLLAEWNQYL